MGRRKFLRWICSLLLLISACGIGAKADEPSAKPAPVTKFDSPIVADRVRPHIEFLAAEELRGRSGKDARKAARYIRQHFEQWKLNPLFEGGSFFQDVPGRTDSNGKRSVAGQNVAGWIPGSDPQLRDEFIIVSAHYDHLGVRNGKIYRGADDNASGVSMMLEVAREISHSKVKPRRSIVFIGFDLEERMLWGSRWFAAHPPWPMEQVKLFITADMIGRSLGNLPLPAVFVLGSEHSSKLVESMRQVGEPKGLEVARLGIDLIGTRSDYGPFRDRKVPFLFFSTGEHPDYHSPRDLPERIDYEKVARVSSLVLKICTAVANDDETPVWTDEFTPNLDEVRTLNRIATLLLEAEQKRPLTDIQRLIVTQAKHKTQQILERGTMSASERTWLTRLSQLLLLSVF